jgi:8-oxo-dGTP pyrophosphatase MutT (NUDIX family)
MVEPRPASTVILLRENPAAGSARLEVYLARRKTNLKFLGGFHAFPGGALEDQDYDPENQKLSREVNPEEARKLFGGEIAGVEALAHFLAAIREVYEETGVLLARTESGGLPRPEVLAGYRGEIRDGKMLMAEMMKKEKLYFNTRSLKYFDHWVTPEFSPIRYRARFFLAALPPHQSPTPCPIEFENADWINPARALEGFESGEIKMIPPTLHCLKRLAPFALLEELLAAVSGEPLPETKSGWKALR